MTRTHFALRFMFAALLSVAIVSCAPGATGLGEGDESPVLTIKQNAIGMLSSAYEVRVFASGRVTFIGVRNVRVIGEHRYQLAQKELAALLHVLEFGRFSEAQSSRSSYEKVVEITYSRAGRVKNVHFTFGDLLRNPGPYNDLMIDLEASLHTKKLRCPHVVTLQGKSFDTCAPQ